MLTRLVISNYALIDSLELDLGNGLSIITGETGAGKSIILGALSLLLGQRVDTKVIRNNDKKSYIEASFDVKNYHFQSFFKDNDIDYDDMCIIRREILPNGRTRAFINDTPVTLALLADLSIRLVDIHSQHSNTLLLRSDYQLSVIDNLSQNQDLLDEYAEVYKRYISDLSKLNSHIEKIEKLKADQEYYSFQLNSLTMLKLKAGELEELEKQQKKLENVSDVKDCIWSVMNILEDSDNSVVSGLSNASQYLTRLGKIEEESQQLAERIDSVLIEVKDIYETVSQQNDSLVDDPNELERIEERLNSIYSLFQKFRVNSVEELLEIQGNLENSISEIEQSDFEISALQKAVDADLEKITELADKITGVRKKTADAFAKELLTIAQPLGMKNLVCQINFDKVKYNKQGQDQIHFLFAFNKSQNPMPIEQTASGGEMSRLMLCIKTIIAKRMNLPSIIFDEIDTGVSGEIANRIGEMMKSISDNIQVITITHLPQVAAMGHRHYKVYKQDVGEQTITNIVELDYDQRVKEIAGMLGGLIVDEAAINNAKSLLKH